MNPRAVVNRIAATVIARTAAAVPVAANGQQQPADSGAPKLHKGALFRPLPNRLQPRPSGPRQLGGLAGAHELPLGSDPDEAAEGVAGPSVRVRPPVAFGAPFSRDTDARGGDHTGGQPAAAALGAPTLGVSADAGPPQQIALKALAQRLRATIDSATFAGMQTHSLTRELQAVLATSGLKPMGVGELAQVRAVLLEGADQRPPAASEAVRRFNAMLPLMLLHLMRPRTDDQQAQAHGRLGLSVLRRLP